MKALQIILFLIALPFAIVNDIFFFIFHYIEDQWEDFKNYLEDERIEE